MYVVAVVPERDLDLASVGRLVVLCAGAFTAGTTTQTGLVTAGLVGVRGAVDTGANKFGEIEGSEV